jgi:hypothetical protein
MARYITARATRTPSHSSRTSRPPLLATVLQHPALSTSASQSTRTLLSNLLLPTPRKSTPQKSLPVSSTLFVAGVRTQFRNPAKTFSPTRTRALRPNTSPRSAVMRHSAEFKSLLALMPSRIVPSHGPATAMLFRMSRMLVRPAVLLLKRVRLFIFPPR